MPLIYRVCFVLTMLSFHYSCNATLLTLSSDVFINEFHYDNSGADKNEFIEIMGISGTDLTGWSLLLYNGSNGLAYKTINLSGELLNQSNGYGFAAFYQSGIQNGADDAIALVDNEHSVRQFLSYEGAITAQDGVAFGMTSSDIGIMEPGTTPLGQSLQLMGTGTNYQDFSWHLAEATPNNLNSEQQISSTVQVSEPNAVALLVIALILLCSLKNHTQTLRFNYKPIPPTAMPMAAELILYDRIDCCR